MMGTLAYSFVLVIVVATATALTFELFDWMRGKRS